VPTIEEKMRRIALIVCDVDGVLTDGSLPYDSQGRPGRTFHSHDGAGFTLWRMAGGRAALVSGLESPAMEALAGRWHLSECHMDVKNKKQVCLDMAARLGVTMEQTVFLGDDLIDTDAMRAAGLGVAVANATPPAREAADLILERTGGQGALRELVERILAAQGRLADAMAAYMARTDRQQ
jgi:3-deoxy-D-manno-octulosonate 8-phosphate phosphatase (KDO 8-P phosphatase)